MIAKGMAPAAPEVMLRVSGSFVIGDMRDRHRDMERLRETDTWRETGRDGGRETQTQLPERGRRRDTETQRGKRWAGSRCVEKAQEDAETGGGGRGGEKGGRDHR